MTTAAELFALQETDLALDRATARLAEIAETLVETEELLDARREVEEKRAVVGEVRARQKDQEWAVEEVRQKASEVEKKLYGGTVGNPKELADLQADLKAIQSHVSKREDSLLGILVEMEEAEAELARAEAVCAEVEARWASDQQRLLEERAALEPEVARLRSQREGQADGADRSVMGLYQLLRERRAGRAVAKVERGMCQGCRITLPMSVLQKARTGAGLVQCVSCERILLVI
jgi:hypothetical protein